MPLRTFDYCALKFLNQWLEKEANYCKGLSSKSIEIQRKALIEAGGYFGIARNLPKEYENKKNVKRYQAVLEIINNLSGVSTDNVVETVTDTNEFISRHYGGRNVLSLASKFLWLKFKSPVRIYDSQARIALGTKNGDYESFNSEFSEKLDKCRLQIEAACKNLVNAKHYSIEPNMTPDLFDSLISAGWFQERVLDIYLWNEGNA